MMSILKNFSLEKKMRIVMADKMNFKVIELPKIRKQKPDYQDDVYCWLMFIDGRNEEVINMIKEAKPIFEEAEEELEKLYDESELEAIAESRQKWEWDMYSLKQHIMEESLEKGIKQGKKERAKAEKIKTIQAMLRHGFDSKTISSIMQISTKEIKK